LVRSELAKPLWARSIAASALSRMPRGPEPRDATPPPLWPKGQRDLPDFGSGGGGAEPFTPTRMLKKRKVLRKRARFMLHAIETERMEALAAAKNVEPFRAGDVLEITMDVPENRNREAKIRALCIARRNRGLGSSFKVRYVLGAEAVERSFPLYMPHLKQIKVVERRPVRRAKLYYIRKLGLKPIRV